MKKLIAFSVIFALLAGVAFAEATLGGQLMIGTTLLKGDNKADDILMGGMQYHEAKMSATFGDAKGGGKLVFTSGHDGAYDGTLGAGWKTAWGFLYWRPIPQFRMQVGVNADGDFGVAQISGWGFVGEAKNSVGAISDYMNWGGGNTWWVLHPWQSFLTRPGAAFFPGTGDLPNVNFSIFPVDGVQINIVLPINENGWYADPNNKVGVESEVSRQLADFQISANVTLEEVGKLSISFVGHGGLEKETKNPAGVIITGPKTKSVGNAYASFYLTAISGMNMELGLVYNLPWKNSFDLDNGGYVGTGFGFRFDNGGQFTFKLRANAKMLGKTDGVDQNTLLYANILPCYKITKDLWAFLYTGLSLEIGANDYQRMGWFVNPYIWVRASEGLRFWSGVQFYQTQIVEDSDTPITWRVPFGFNFYF